MKKINENLALREIVSYTLILWFSDFLCFHETPHQKIPIFNYRISLYKMRFIRIHISCIINNIKRIFTKFDSTFLDPFIKFWYQYCFVHSVSCAYKTLFIIFSLTLTPKLSSNIFFKEVNVSFLPLNKTPNINPIIFSFNFIFLPGLSRLFSNALSSLYIFFLFCKK